VETWPSDANFLLFRPITRSARQVWDALLASSVLVRDCSTWPGLDECLRVTVGTPAENDRFLSALRSALGESEQETSRPENARQETAKQENRA
jgi:histidinol-phosphate aminotransferase